MSYHPSAGTPAWGNITGTLSNQTDLNSSLSGKVNDTGDTLSGNLNLGGNKITNLAAGSSNGEALRFNELGANSGIATLDSGGKIPASQLPASVMEYKGAWNASTNTPTLADGTGSAGDIYVVSVGGTRNLGSGNITFVAGDWVLYNGSIWEKSVNSAAVSSVNGYSGAVTLVPNDLTMGTDDTVQFTALGLGATPAGKLSILNNTLSNNITGSFGIFTSDPAGSYDTVIGLGADATNHVGYIQSASYNSYTSRPLTLNPNGGNVGIGATSASSQLTVTSAINNGIKVTDGTVSGIAYSSSTLTNSFAVGTTSNHPLIFGTNNVFPAMMIDTSQRVGIGLTNPGATLQVDAAGGGIIRASRIGAGSNYIQMEADGTNGSLRSDGALILSAGSSERVRIDASGNVGIGVAAPGNSLHVRRTDGNVLSKFETTATDGNGWIEVRNDAQSYLVGVRGDSSDAFTVYDNINSADRLRILTDGRLICAGVYDNTDASAANVYVDSNGYLKRSTASGGSGTINPGTANAVAVYNGTTTIDDSQTLTHTSGLLRLSYSSDAIYETISDGTGGSGRAAKLLLQTTRASATDGGDAFVHFTTGNLAGTLYNWTAGCDQSDAGRFKISRGSTLGTNDAITIHGTTGIVGIGGNAVNYPLEVFASTSSTSSVQTVLSLKSSTTGTAAAGFGSAMEFAAETDGGAILFAGDLQYVWTNPSSGSRTTDVVFNVEVSGSYTERVRFVGSNGTIKAPGVYNTTTASAANLNVASDGVISRSTSSVVYKDNIEDVSDIAAEALLALRPVTFTSKSPSDDPTIRHYGFIAEEAELIDSKLVSHRTEVIDEVPTQIPDGFQYDRLTVGLLKLVQKMHTRIQALEARVEALEQGV